MFDISIYKKYGAYPVALFVLVFIFSLINFPREVFAVQVIYDYGYTLTINGGQGKSFATDSLGNVFVTGYFNGTNVDFDPGVGADLHSSVSSPNIFITKMNADGSYGYTKTMGGNKTVAGNSITTDSSGNVYVTGYFSGTNVDFDPSGGTDLLTSSGGNGNSVFLTKINADGSYGYTKKITSSASNIGNNNGLAVTTDSSGNVYLTGLFYSTNVDFDPSGGTDLHSSNAYEDIFITKINADGSYGYTKTMGGSLTDYGLGIAVDSTDNVYVTGFYAGSNVDFDSSGGTDLHTSSNDSQDIFLTKINADGSYGYTKTIGGGFTENSEDKGTSIKIDSSNNIYLVGSFSNGTNVDFDPGVGTDLHTSNGASDIYLTKINADGSYGYTKTIGGNFFDVGQSIYLDSLNNIYLTGYFYGSNIDFDPSGGIDLHSTNNSSFQDIFVTKINADGSYGYTLTLGGSDNSQGDAILIDSSNNVFVTGTTSSDIDFDLSLNTDLHSSGGFITKFSSDLVFNYHIINLNSPVSAETSVGGLSVDDPAVDEGILNGVTENIRLLDDGVPVADIDAAFDSDLDWSGVTVDSNSTSYKSFVYNLTTVNGAGTDYTLYVPYRSGDEAVVVCPDAVAIDNVWRSCMGGTTHTNGSGASIVTIGIDQFWAIPNQTNGGGVSVVTAVPASSTENLVYEYTKSLGVVDGYSGATYLGVDSADNVYITGYFNGIDMDFDPSSGTDLYTSNNGTDDIFLTKINSDGSYGYTKIIGGDSSDTVNGLVVDSNNNIYLTGIFYSTDVDFDPSGSVDLHTRITDSDFFLTKINADGSYGYTKTFGGGSGDVSSGSVAVDSADNVYITGYFNGTDVDFDPSVATDLFTSNSSSADIFLTKINADGSYGYTKIFGGSAEDYGSNVAVDSSDNLYMAGSFFSTDIDFDPSGSVDTHDSGGDRISFLTKINADGSYAYTHSSGGGSGGYNLFNSMLFDTDDNLYFLGYIFGTDIDVDLSAGVDLYTSNNESSDIVLTKINTDGSYAYSKIIGGVGDDTPKSLALDSSGDLYFTGYFYADVDFDPSVGIDLFSSNGNNDIFLTKINADGSYGYTYNMGSIEDENSNAIKLDSDDNVYIAGLFTGLMDFNPMLEEDFITNFGGDIFLTKFSQISLEPTPEPVVEVRASGSRPRSYVKMVSNVDIQQKKNSIESLKDKYIFSRNLRFGITGEDVRELQKYLNAHGFTVSATGAGSSGKETNVFGLKTKSALMKFQKSKGLVSDGIVGPMTRERLNAE